MMKNILIVIFLILTNIKAEFIRDNSLQVVNDTTTCLIWQDNSSSKTVQKNWQEAIEYCQNLNFAGYSDWRLPNIYELVSITNEKKYNPAINDAFLNSVSDGYWSSSTGAGDSSAAWSVVFYYGYDGWYGKDSNVYVRCVRAGQ